MAESDPMAREPRQVLDHATLVARSRPRADADAKLRGAAGYPSDRLRPDQLHGAILGSPLPHARVLAIDTSIAAAMPGVRAVVTAADIPGPALYGLRHVDRPALCSDRLRCVGDPVAAVAADTPELARAALAAIRLTLEPLPVVDDPEAALASGATPVHAAGNLLHRVDHRRGGEDARAAAEAACVRIVETEYHSPRQMHVCLETEGGVAEPDGQGGLVLWWGCQNPERDRQVIAAMLRLPAERVRVVGSPVGGSYGAKDELTVQPIAALLALRSGRAVRLQLSRPASTDLGVKRHAMRIRMRSGCDADGRLRLHEVDILADTGAYATHGPEVLDAAVEHSVGPYAWDALVIQARLAYTNNGIAGAFRGFGAVQSQWALEQQIDRLARACGIDPLDFRLRNLVAADAPGPLGQEVVASEGPRLALAQIARHPLWLEGPPPDPEGGRYRLGTGLALVHRSDGFARGGPNGAKLALALAADGRIELRVSLTEMGQSLADAMRALAVRHLGCAEDDLRPVIGDSALAPDTGAAAASRSTTILHRALSGPGRAWMDDLTRLAGAQLGVPPASLRFGPGGWSDAQGRSCLTLGALACSLAGALPERLIELDPEETPSAVPGAHWVFGACAALARVRIDTWTGALQVMRLAIASALGPVVSPMGLLGQMEGGALMGQGLATTEHLPMQGGRYLARNLDAYLVPTLADAPRAELWAIEDLLPDDPVGPRGAGEIAVNIAVPAIANAVSAAIGMPVDRLPVAPDDLLDFLERQP
jgi:CO/xanthine dehydrogenase Mo-binding subunit